MKRSALLIISFVIMLSSLPSICFAYLTEKAVGNEMLCGNKAGTHNEFTKYTIANIDIRPDIKEELKKVQDTILAGNSNEDDKLFAAFTHFYDPFIPNALQPGLLGCKGGIQGKGANR